MILQADAKSLEVYCAAYLSQDKLLMQELIDGLDMHSLNQEAFGLPSRLIAKILIFRILYGGNEYSFANDPDFATVSKSKDYWAKVIDKFYAKYKGLAVWHNQIIQQVTLTGQLVAPTGRVYKFERTSRGDWPVTQIKNFIVQGLGADLMSIARVSFMRRFKNENFSGVLVNTVHDSIVVDLPEAEIKKCVKLFDNVFADIPTNFRKLFGVEFNIPLRCECGAGSNFKELVVVS